MLGWLLVAVALAALFLDPGLWGMVVVAGIVLVYLLVRARSWDGPREHTGSDVERGSNGGSGSPDEPA